MKNHDFWPDLETADIAVRRATEIRTFIAARIAASISESPEGTNR